MLTVIGINSLDTKDVENSLTVYRSSPSLHSDELIWIAFGPTCTLSFNNRESYIAFIHKLADFANVRVDDHGGFADETRD